MPRKSEKEKHSVHHDMHDPHGEKTDEGRDILKGKPFPLNSKPNQTYVMKDPIKTLPRKG
jgi:hypothetical protein